MVNCHDPVGLAAHALLDCVEEAMQSCERPPFGLVFFSPGGEVAWDDCCSGQLWVRVTEAIPDYSQGAACNITALRVTLATGFLRCVNGLDEDGFPTASELTQDANSMSAEAMVLFNAIRCCGFTSEVNPKSIVIQNGTPLGSQGLCAGWEWRVQFQLLLCDPC